MAINDRVMREQADLMVDTIARLALVCEMTTPEKLSDHATPTAHVREVAEALRVLGGELVSISAVFDFQADFADNTRDVELLALRVFGPVKRGEKKDGE